MCKLTQNKSDVVRHGYKVVAKKDGKYYSLAMGFCYNDHEYIPTVKTQERLSTQFTTDILQKGSFAFEPNMIGRTCVFEYLRDAQDIYDEACVYTEKDYTVVIVRATVRGDIMSGSYGTSRVVGGRKIEFSNEVTQIK